MFCHRHGYDSDSKDMDILSRHMLLHVKAKTAFCFAPKVGCTNLKILFYLSQGKLIKIPLLWIINLPNIRHLLASQSCIQKMSCLKKKAQV